MLGRGKERVTTGVLLSFLVVMIVAIWTEKLACH